MFKFKMQDRSGQPLLMLWTGRIAHETASHAISPYTDSCCKDSHTWTLPDLLQTPPSTNCVVTKRSHANLRSLAHVTHTPRAQHAPGAEAPPSSAQDANSMHASAGEQRCRSPGRSRTCGGTLSLGSMTQLQSPSMAAVRAFRIQPHITLPLTASATGRSISSMQPKARQSTLPPAGTSPSCTQHKQQSENNRAVLLLHRRAPYGDVQLRAGGQLRLR